MSRAITIMKEISMKKFIGSLFTDEAKPAQKKSEEWEREARDNNITFSKKFFPSIHDLRIQRL